MRWDIGLIEVNALIVLNVARNVTWTYRLVLENGGTWIALQKRPLKTRDTLIS